MSARYVPPLGAVGSAIDRAVLFRVAEATLKDFLDRGRMALTERASRDAASRRTPRPAVELAAHR